MRNTGRQNGNGARVIDDFNTRMDADSLSGDDLMGFQLGFVHVMLNTFVRSNAHQMIAEPALRVFGGDDVFQFHPRKGWMFRPGNIRKGGCFGRQFECAFVESVKE